MYKLPRLLDINAKSTLFRDSKKLLVASRCLETEKPWLIEEFKKKGYIVVTACPEAEHVNMLGFKLCGILARCSFEEIAVLSVDGSMHCTQLHWMLEEVFKIVKPGAQRRHFVVYEGDVVEVSEKTVKYSRYLAKVERLTSEKRENSSLSQLV